MPGVLAGPRTTGRDGALVPAGLVEQISGLVWGLLSLRIAWLLVTIVLLGRGTVSGPGVSFSMVTAGLASLVPLWYWHRLAPSLLSRPGWLAVDLFAAVAIITATGATGPFLHFTLTTPALCGLLHRRRGALIASILLAAVYVAVLSDGGQVTVSPATFQAVLGVPALYPMAAAAAAGARVLLERQAHTEVELAAARERMAAERERTRLARELHDSLAKTVQGIGLLATTLEVSAGRESPTAAQTARDLTAAARTAAAEARELVGQLRRDPPDRPFAESVREQAEAWSEQTGIEVLVLAEVEPEPAPDVRWELLAILGEALHNVAAHARARHVTVALQDDGEGILLAVQDDGIGLPRPLDERALTRSGSYGIVGMRERAERFGGRLELGTPEGGGARVLLRLPARPSALR